MNVEDFVSRAVQSVNSVTGLPRLKLVFADLISFEDRILMERAGVNHSRHKDHSYNSKRNIFDPCHDDYSAYKDKC
jgi:hypothetical protein